MRDARPIADRQREQLPRTERLLHRSLALTREARPLVAELRGARVPDRLRAVAALTSELLAQDRLRRLFVRANDVLGETRARNLVQKTARAAELMPELVALQRQALTTAVQTLAIAREAERHAESLDRKFGGETSRPPATR